MVSFWCCIKLKFIFCYAYWDVKYLIGAFMQAFYNSKGFSWIDLWCIIRIKSLWLAESWMVRDICNVNSSQGEDWISSCLQIAWVYLSIYLRGFALINVQVHKAVDACKNVIRGLHSNKITPRELDRVSFFKTSHCITLHALELFWWNVLQIAGKENPFDETRGWNQVKCLLAWIVSAPASFLRSKEGKAKMFQTSTFPSEAIVNDSG